MRGESISLQVPINPYSTAGLPSPSSPSLQSPQGPPGDSNFLTIPDTVFRSRSKSCESNQPSSNRSSSPDLASLDPSSQNNRGLSVRPRSKTQAVAMNLSESQSAANLLALETKLPQAGNLGGKCLERVLYETSADCSICFLSYPKWLNKTRCCDQPICSECFVQIKRPDPHVPEHHGDANSGRPPSPQLASDLVSEAACCPFCKVPEFGISYDAPPFRRGLAYANSEISKMAAARAEELSAAMILETAEISASPPQQTETRRRMKSLSVDDPSVITTDMIRPDWAQKLSNARAQLHRRAAAATALHTAAYMMGNDGRSPFGFGFGRRGLLRHGFGEGTGPNGAEEADPGSRSAFEEYVRSRMEDANHPRAGAGAGAGPSSMPEAGNPFFGFGARPSQHQPRIVDIEDMMMMEAIRQSLIEDEERKKRDENVARKRGRFRGNSATGGDRGGA